MSFKTTTIALEMIFHKRILIANLIWCLSTWHIDYSHISSSITWFHSVSRGSWIWSKSAREHSKKGLFWDFSKNRGRSLRALNNVMGAPTLVRIGRRSVGLKSWRRPKEALAFLRFLTEFWLLLPVLVETRTRFRRWNQRVCRGERFLTDSEDNYTEIWFKKVNRNYLLKRRSEMDSENGIGECHFRSL